MKFFGDCEMVSENWECMEIYSKTFHQINNLILELVELLMELKKESNLKTYFFNRYSDQSKNLFFIKLGLVNCEKEGKSKINDLFENYGVLEDIKPYDCEMWEVDGVSIDKIKCMSCEMFEKVKEGFDKKISIEQAFYLIHFLIF